MADDNSTTAFQVGNALRTARSVSLLAETQGVVALVLIGTLLGGVAGIRMLRTYSGFAKQVTKDASALRDVVKRHHAHHPTGAAGASSALHATGSAHPESHEPPAASSRPPTSEAVPHGPEGPKDAPSADHGSERR
jgi:hypothetical protein